MRLRDEQVEEKELDENRVKAALQELLESDKEAKEARRQRYAKNSHQYRLPTRTLSLPALSSPAPPVQRPCSAHLAH